MRSRGTAIKCLKNLQVSVTNRFVARKRREAAVLFKRGVLLQAMVSGNVKQGGSLPSRQQA